MTQQIRRVPRYEELTVRGLSHRLTWWGERTETPIVLLHGFLDCGATWQFLADELPDDWSLVAPDWRGFGHSAWAPGGYWFPDYLADLEVLLGFLSPDSPARIVGHSMGANVAQLYGGIRPARLAWLANLEGLGLPRTAPQEAPGRYARWLDQLRQSPRVNRYASVAQLAEVLRLRNRRLTPERAEFIARAWTRPAARGTGERAGEIELLFDPRHRLVNPILYRRDEAEASWARIQAPVLLCTGEESEYRSTQPEIASAEAWRAWIPNLRIVTLPGVGHMMHHEDAATLARHIVEFDRDSLATAERR